MATTSFTKKTLGFDVEPAVTPPPANSETTFLKKPKLGGKQKKKEIPEGLWTKCPKCETMVFDKELDENLKVCPKCSHHFTIGARERIHSMVETCSFEEMDADMTSVDVLRFTGVASYKDKLEAYQKTTGLKDSVITGCGKLGSFRVALGVMDFSFLGGSMGSVVGEKLTRLIETATDRGLEQNGPAGYNPAIGDYWFGVTDARGTPLTDDQGHRRAGRVEACYSCHLEREADDFLFGVPSAMRSHPR